MKFQFCGNLECPDWFLAESAILAKITAIKIKLVVQQLMQHLIDDVENSVKIISLLENSGFNLEEINSVVASIQFIISSAICYDVNESVLIKELTDLGLPKENVEQITKIYKLNKEKLKQKQIKSVLRLSRLKDINYSVSKFIISNEKSALEGEELSDYPSKFADVKLKWQNSGSVKLQEQKFIVFEDKLNDLVFELDKAMNLMTKITTQNSQNQ